MLFTGGLIQLAPNKKKTYFKLAKSRPDGCICIIEGNDEKNVGFAEVKTVNDQLDHYKVNLNFYKLGRFSKEAIDANKLVVTLAVQAVGEFH